MFGVPFVLMGRVQEETVMADKFQEGDLVQVKSGGPEMTVAEIKEPQYGNPKRYRCVWFKGADKETSLFEGEILEKVTKKND